MYYLWCQRIGVVENSTPTKLFWYGKDIEDLTREELIKALYQCHNLYEETVKSHRVTLNMWSMFSEARNTTIPRKRR